MRSPEVSLAPISTSSRYAGPPGAAVNPEGAILTFSSPDGTAVVKLGHKYDLTTETS
jgi:hypothetical protein